MQRGTCKSPCVASSISASHTVYLLDNAWKTATVIISKVIKSVVDKHHLLQYNLLSSKQFGFRPGHSTGVLLTILSQNWNATLDKGEEVCVIALDIKGSFDEVWHNGLHTKLKSKGVSGMLLRWLQSYLSERSMTVVLSGQNSEASSINACASRVYSWSTLLTT